MPPLPPPLQLTEDETVPENSFSPLRVGPVDFRTPSPLQFSTESDTPITNFQDQFSEPQTYQATPEDDISNFSFATTMTAFEVSRTHGTFSPGCAEFLASSSTADCQTTNGFFTTDVESWHRDIDFLSQQYEYIPFDEMLECIDISIDQPILPLITPTTTSPTISPAISPSATEDNGHSDLPALYFNDPRARPGISSWFSAGSMLDPCTQLLQTVTSGLSQLSTTEPAQQDEEATYREPPFVSNLYNPAATSHLEHITDASPSGYGDFAPLSPFDRSYALPGRDDYTMPSSFVPPFPPLLPRSSRKRTWEEVEDQSRHDPPPHNQNRRVDYLGQSLTSSNGDCNVPDVFGPPVCAWPPSTRSQKRSRQEHELDLHEFGNERPPSSQRRRIDDLPESTLPGYDNYIFPSTSGPPFVLPTSELSRERNQGDVEPAVDQLSDDLPRSRKRKRSHEQSSTSTKPTRKHDLWEESVDTSASTSSSTLAPPSKRLKTNRAKRPDFPSSDNINRDTTSTTQHSPSGHDYDLDELPKHRLIVVDSVSHLSRCSCRKKPFSRKSDAIRHIETIAGDSRVLCVTCFEENGCIKTFCRRDSLKRHIRSAHTEEREKRRKDKAKRARGKNCVEKRNHLV